MIREEIQNLIERAIRELQRVEKIPKFDLPEIEIEHPKEELHGDYATNVAIVVAKELKKNPLEIAEIITDQLLVTEKEKFEKIEVKRPGFINFFLSKEYLQEQVEEILRQGEKFGKLKIGKGRKIQLEFISANPTGPLHLGHGRGAFFGDILVNVLEKAGYRVCREYYINDAKNSNQIKELGKTALGKGTTYLNLYLSEKLKAKGEKLKKIKSEAEAGYLLAREVQKDIKKFIEKKLKIKFDNWVSEEGLYKKNRIRKIYNWLEKKNLAYEKEGAKWLRISQFGAPKDEVIIRQTAEPTYFLADIAYHQDKFERGFQKIINIWGADHHGHVPKIKAVAKMLGYKGNLNILISQVVRLKEGKMSKRKGQIVTLEDLIKEVGLDVARFLYLTKSLDTQMEFDLALAKRQSEKNPVYYVQYAHARIWSILKKSLSKIHGKQSLVDFSLLTHPSELALIKQLIRFPEIVEDTARDYQAQRIPQYALDLATAFHQFYRDCRVLTEEKSLSKVRLALILATKVVLKNTLNLMGISAPKKM